VGEGIRERGFIVEGRKKEADTPQLAAGRSFANVTPVKGYLAAEIGRRRGY
jgi:hypothetical protein